jgi:hypothetical protein
MADGGWLVRYRITIYQALNLAALLALPTGATLHGLPSGQAIYAWLLVALCSAPLLFLRQLNDRYALLGLFMGCYFLFFGAADVQILLLGTEFEQPARYGLITPAEMLILTGAVAALAGYLLVAVTWKPDRTQRTLAEWPAAWILVIGFTLWVVGLAASFYYQVYVVPSKIGFAAAKGLSNVNPILLAAVMAGQMMLSVGALMLAYGYAKYGGLWWTILTVVVVAVQVVLAFIEDSKMMAIMAPVLVVMTRVMATNRLSKGWIAYLVVFLIVAFPIFQAYRVINGEYGLDRAQALQRFDKVFEAAVSASDRMSTGRGRTENFLERSSSKQSLDMLLEHVGVDVPYLGGASLQAIPLAFVPRLIMDKEDISVGSLFGKLILKSDSGVYISISHLGELYWNFGWSGTIVGMFVVGAILGFVGTRWSLENGVTLTRVMVLLATAQTLCMGFGGTLPIAYVLWQRGMAAIGLMHLCFARRVTRAADVTEPTASDEPAAPRLRTNLATLPVAIAQPMPRFPNLLR